LNYLTSDSPVWHTLADVIAAKLLGGKSPEILEAITFSPKDLQPGLRTISIAGNSNYWVEPATDDFFKRLIDLRTTIKAKLKNASALNTEALNSEQQALKILANSTSYGIFVELNIADLDAPEKLACYGPSGKDFSVESMKIEEPGKFFHPLLATLITGAARLMLAIAESLCFQRDLDWAFCDTDSMAIAKPDEMGEAGFFEQARSICEWFSPLNPYEKKGSIFKIEDANFPIANSEEEPKFEPLYCLCISAKRYALFNAGKFGEIIIRKASAHGLGQYLAPYEEEDAPGSIPPPSVPLDAIGVDRWQYDLWHEIIRGALEGRPDEVGLSYHEGLNRAAASRYGATTPALLKWFQTFNHERAYADQVKPFNFLNAFQARLQLGLSDADQSAISKRGRPRKQSAIRPVAPFDKDMHKAARLVFDRETGSSVRADTLATYAEALAQYHLRPEAKFLNGNFFDRGRTERRHVIAVQILHIGKEANRWEEQYFLGPDDDAEIEYGDGQTADELDLSLRELCRELGEREAARKLAISRTALRRAMSLGVKAMSRAIRGRIAARLKWKDIRHEQRHGISAGF
jgi:DNA polymerase elongation subunit (family B)